VLAERALLTEMGVLSDPVARTMVSPPWAAFIWFVHHWPSPRKPWSVPRAGLAARVLWHDAQVISALDAGIEQIAVIGAGYDSRAWRFASDGVQFYELDRGTTQRDKMRRAPIDGPEYVDADLSTQGASSVLLDHGLDRTRPALFILEGLTMYLSEDVVRRLLGDLAALSSSGSRISVDFYPPPDAGTARDRRQMSYQRWARTASGEELKLLVDRPQAAAIVEASGWVVTEATSMRDAAREFVERESGLPVDAVNEHKTLVAAVRSDR
jgi:methyltransferase (TIGR00027 family)